MHPPVRLPNVCFLSFFAERDLGMSWFSKRLIVPAWLWFILVLVAFELLADIFAKQFGTTGKILFGVLSILGYILANLAWLLSLRAGAQLSKGSIIFSAFSGAG